ncbi:hypothetical protein D917_04768, partial [Trichinella nativa]
MLRYLMRLRSSTVGRIDLRETHRHFSMMVLKPLEFADCVTDSPWFRANLREHELALERSYKSIKLLESQSKELISAGQ